MLNIRPEKPSDYPAIADIHIRAFNRAAEATIVSLLRQQQSYDADLSLVATVNGQIAGHAMFMPYTVMFMQVPVPGVCLAPLGIHPEYQAQGVGGALLDAGHRIARAKGYPIAFLLGHPTYYPRYGYQTRVFGNSTVTMNREHVLLNALPVETRTPQPNDVEKLFQIWLYDEQQVDFALRPERNLNAWLSPNPSFPATVYLINGNVVGYTRGRPEQPLVFLSGGPESTRAIVSHLLHSASNVTLPLHPASQSLRALPLEPLHIQGWDAAMLNVLLDNTAVRQYLNAIAAGQRPVGRVIWPPAFDVG